jgi:hypothetical protein
MGGPAEPQACAPDPGSCVVTATRTRADGQAGTLDPLIRALGLAVERSAQSRHKDAASAQHS